MCKETFSRHRHCTHSRLLSRTYCSLIEPPSRRTAAAAAAAACPRYQQHREKPSAKTPCFACKRQERIREILEAEQETARAELRAAGFSEENVKRMAAAPTGFLMPRLFPRGGGGETVVHPLFRHAQEARGAAAGDKGGLAPTKVGSRSSGSSSGDSAWQKEAGGGDKKKTGKGVKKWIREFLLAENVRGAVSIGFPKMDA